ncbi:MAG: protease modulator HflC [Verrucomicrobia bacterium]|nr:protease modulator HflC [Verrucomicrobiota bacterium]
MTMRRNILTLVTAAVLVLIFVLYMITFVVREGEVVVLTTFQKVVRVIDKPGLYFKAPPPIQRVVTLDARLHTDKDRFEETKTSDGVLLVLLAYYNWRVAEPRVFYTKFYARDRAVTLEAARKVLGDVVRDAKDDVFGRYSFADLIPRFSYAETPGLEAAASAADDGSLPALGESTRPREVVAEPKFREIEAAILNSVQEKALKEYGVEITRVGIMRFELPQATTQFVFKRMQAEREKVAAAIRDSGEAQAEGIKTDANTARSTILAAAAAQAEKERALGDNEAAEYYDTFAQNPELHDFLRKLQSLRVIINEGTTLVLGTDTAPFEILRSLPAALLKTVTPAAPVSGMAVEPAGTHQ